MLRPVLLRQAELHRALTFSPRAAAPTLPLSMMHQRGGTAIALSERFPAATPSWSADAGTGPGAAPLQLPPRTSRRRRICRRPRACAGTRAVRAVHRSDLRRASFFRRPCVSGLRWYRRLLRRSGNRARGRATAGARDDAGRKSSFHAHATPIWDLSTADRSTR
jgi:hypothetical protein